MSHYIIEWVPKHQYAEQSNLNVHHSEITAASAASAAVQAQAEHYGPYRVNRVYELTLDLSEKVESNGEEPASA